MRSAGFTSEGSPPSGGRTPLRMAGITLDITDRKRAEEHRDLLARELSHRVKNTLATGASPSRAQTLRTAASLEDKNGEPSTRVSNPYRLPTTF